MRITHNGLIVTASLLFGMTSRSVIFQGQDSHGGVESVSSALDSKIKVMASASLPIKLGPGPVTVTLAPASAAGEATLSVALKSLKPEEHLYIVLRDLKASEPPGVLYDVYLDLPQGARTKPEEHQGQAGGELVGAAVNYDIAEQQIGSQPCQRGGDNTEIGTAGDKSGGESHRGAD